MKILLGALDMLDLEDWGNPILLISRLVLSDNEHAESFVVCGGLEPDLIKVSAVNTLQLQPEAGYLW